MSRALIIPSNLFPAFSHLTDEENGRLLIRAIRYVQNEYEDHDPNEKGAEAVAWSLVKENIRSCGEKYDRACAQRKDAINSRWHPDGPNIPRRKPMRELQNT